MFASVAPRSRPVVGAQWLGRGPDASGGGFAP